MVQSPALEPERMPTTYGPYKATVISVHDGDTATLALQVTGTLDAGFGIVSHIETVLTLACRVYGINAPELSTDAGKAARDYAQAVLTIGSEVLVLSYGWDKYGGRFDGAITLTDGNDFGTQMIATGHAVAYHT